MSLPKHYDPRAAELRWQALWEAEGTFRFDPLAPGEIYSIDTPPPTVSGSLHVGHLFSYTHQDVIARYRRMRGRNVFYPFGFDDNGLPTERLLERRTGLRVRDLPPEEATRRCLELGRETADQFRRIYQRMGLSADWTRCYSTASAESRRISQQSFIELHRAGRIYRAEAPNLWCPECRTAIAQAETADAETDARLLTIDFRLPGGGALPIATTRPELLPACVAAFVHPEDGRFSRLVGGEAASPLFGERVPILCDERVDPAMGTGAVMCCTFGDSTDVEWWRDYALPCRTAIDEADHMMGLGGEFAGMQVDEARRAVTMRLKEKGLLRAAEPISHAVNTHERCDTPVELRMTWQWFLRVLDMKPDLIAAGRGLQWRPDHMRKRYEHWVENLRWDWCLSRQRPFGVPVPVWFCEDCGEAVLANDGELPVDPRLTAPTVRCNCGSRRLRPERDVMDTWATSSLTPQISTALAGTAVCPEHLRPMSLRPHAHDIIRTWTFYSIVRALLSTGDVPWRSVLISGFALQEGSTARARKISKSRNADSGLMGLLDRESADAIRYWACGARPGRDAVFSPGEFAVGRRLMTKLYNAVKFAGARLAGFGGYEGRLLAMDRWLLSKLAATVAAATRAMDECDGCAARDAVERFLWDCLCDNYIEMAKNRLYEKTDTTRRRSAQAALRAATVAVLRMLAPVMPHVTEELYQAHFAGGDARGSIHTSPWPEADPERRDAEAEELGDLALSVLQVIRRRKTAAALADAARIAEIRTHWVSIAPELAGEIMHDIASAARAEHATVCPKAEPGWEPTPCGRVRVWIAPRPTA